MLRTLTLLITMIFLSSAAMADEGMLSKYMTTPQIVGEARMTYMFWDVYDATLFAPQGSYSADQPYALQLSYLRNLNGKAIAERSIEEMRKQGLNDEAKLNQWLTEMIAIFPDVDDKTVLTGVRNKKGYAVFYKNGQKIDTVKDIDFANAFFGIWLNAKTSQPRLRKKLLGTQI